MNFARATLLILFFLTSCGPPQPVYRTDFQYVPPRSENGRMCLNNCLMMQQNCHASCGIQMQQCSINNNFAQQQARDYAEDAFRDYVRERRAQGKLIKKDRDNFYSDPSQPCADDACHGQCGGDYNMCYSNCGGQVIAHTACIANCNLQQP